MPKSRISKQERQIDNMPVFMTAAQMSKVCGVGENTLRSLMDSKQLEYAAVGNRRLLTIESVMNWYERNKVRPVSQEAGA